MSTETIQWDTSSDCTVLHDVSWESYEQFLAENDECRIPHSFVNGELRLMAPSIRHESPKKWIAQLIEALTEELGIQRRSIGSLTIKLGIDQKGAEPDEGYLIANAPALKGKREYDVNTDPPPDLLVEIDVTSPSLNRLPVYAALGVPEVWVYDGRYLQVRRRRDAGSYETVDSSTAFPTLPMQEFANWIEQAYLTDETDWIRNFRKWVRENLKPVE